MLGAIAGILTYMAYNQLVFGGPVPVSGATKRAWSQHKWQETGGFDLLQNLREMMALRVFDDELLVAAGIIVGAALLWWWLRRSRRREDRLLLLFVAGMASLAAGHLAKFAQSALTVQQPWAYFSWYFVPAYLMMALAYPVGCMVALYLARRFVLPRKARAAGILRASVVMACTVYLLAQTDFDGIFLSADRWSEQVAPRRITLRVMSTLVMNRLLPEDSIIGSWDAGVTGYFARFPVVNLDGLVNDYAYLRQYGGEYGAGNATRFGTTYYAHTPRGRRRADDDNIMIYENKIKEEKTSTFSIWTAELRDVGSLTDFFWNRMERHFDFAKDGVGLVLDGRLAQAFAQDCGPGDGLLWRWSQDAAGGRVAVGEWTKTQTGLCAAIRILPHGAGAEVRAETLKTEALLAELVGAAAPAIAADFEVWLAEGQLVYRREDCAAEDVAVRFFLHLVPLDVGDLPEWRQQYGFDNLDFDFGQYGGRDGATCLALAPLPAYGIAEIRTGQFVARDEGYETLWAGAIWTEALVALVAALVGDAAPAIAADFEVWLAEGQLVYRREDCAAEDVDAPFFLHIVPLDVGDLPLQRQQFGFGRYDFRFEQYGARDGATCLAVVSLPTYGIAEIRTGQSVARDEGFENLWAGAIWTEALVALVAELIGDVAPEVSADFEVWLAEGQLVYRRQNCAAEDVDAPFFLHIVPLDVGDLPAERQLYGFDNLNFRFEQHGTRDGDTCLALVSLPGYGIAEIRTGQYVARDEGYENLWRGAIQTEALVAELVGDAAPDISADFEVWLAEGQLVYRRRDCAAEDVDAPFFLHLVPLDVGDLPAERREIGFENRDFRFERYGTQDDESCLALVPLPTYGIAEIRTGQFVARDEDFENLWTGTIRPA